VASFDHPPARRCRWVALLALCLTLTADDVRDVAVRQNDLQGVVSAVACIGAQMLAATLLGHWTLDDAGCQYSIKFLHIVRVRPGHDER